MAGLWCVRNRGAAMRQLTPDHPLRRLFAGLTEQTFLLTLGMADPRLIDYLSLLLSRFVHMDAIFRMRNSQGRRLEEVASKNRREARLREGLRRTTIAAVGPVVGRAIEQAGARVSIMPENFHMRPMVTAILEALDLEG